MNESNVVVPASDTTAQVTQTDQVAPAPAKKRGRVASASTVAIRSMLEATDGVITFSAALPELQKAGHDVDQNSFNVIKSAWKRAKRPDAPKANTGPKKHRVGRPKGKHVVKHAKRETRLPVVTAQEAIAYVDQVGGLAKAEADVRKRVALVKAFRKLVKQTSKLAA